MPNIIFEFGATTAFSTQKARILLRVRDDKDRNAFGIVSGTPKTSYDHAGIR